MSTRRHEKSKYILIHDRRFAFRLKARDEISRKFKINYYKLKRNWTEKSREMIREFEEIRKIRMDTLSENLDMSNSRSTINESKGRSVLEQYSIGVFISCIESGIDILIDRLLIMNIKTHRSIMMMINIYENILQEEIKAFLDSLISTFFNLREAENTYAQVLTENVKLVVNNTQKLIPTMFLNKFENR